MSTDPAPSDQDRRTCTPCRGTGRVISNLGGERREINCPWCEGSGEFEPGRDAQEKAPAAPEAEAGENPPPAPETGQ